MGLFLMGFYCMEKEGNILDIQLFDSVFLGSLIFGGAYPMFISGCLWSIIETNYEKLNSEMKLITDDGEGESDEIEITENMGSRITVKTWILGLLVSLHSFTLFTFSLAAHSSVLLRRAIHSKGILWVCSEHHNHWVLLEYEFDPNSRVA
jgi:hypothetical protein